MKNKTFTTIITVFGLLIIGFFAFGFHLYNELKELNEEEEKAQIQSHIAYMSGKNQINQEEDETELQRIKEEREKVLAEERQKVLEGEKATAERLATLQNDCNNTYEENTSYSSDENRYNTSTNSNPYTKYMKNLTEHTMEYRSGSWRGNPMQLVFLQRAIIQDYDDLIRTASSLGDERRYNGFTRAKEIQMAQFRQTTY